MHTVQCMETTSTTKLMVYIVPDLGKHHLCMENAPGSMVHKEYTAFLGRESSFSPITVTFIPF